MKAFTSLLTGLVVGKANIRRAQALDEEIARNSDAVKSAVISVEKLSKKSEHVILSGSTVMDSMTGMLRMMVENDRSN